MHSYETVSICLRGKRDIKKKTLLIIKKHPLKDTSLVSFAYVSFDEWATYVVTIGVRFNKYKLLSITTA